MENFNDFMADDILIVDEPALSEAMWDFIASLGDDVLGSLTEEQLGEYVEIVEAVASDEDDLEIDEAMPAKKVRRDMIKKRAASREHRKVKSKRKLEGKRKRKTAEFKRFKKKSKRLGKRGLTSTGKRKRTYINKG